MSLVRAAALGACAISGEREAKNSCSCSLTRSHGGFPRRQEKPPGHPSGPPSLVLGSPKTSGNSRFQWKNRYSSASRCTSATMSASAGLSGLAAILSSTSCVTGVVAPGSKGHTNAAVQASAWSREVRTASDSSNSSHWAARSRVVVMSSVVWRIWRRAAARVVVLRVPSLANRLDCPERSILFCLRTAAAYFLSSPEISLNAASGTPSVSSAGVAPMRLFPTRMRASRNPSGLPGSRASSQSDTLASSAARSLMSTP